MKVIIYGTRGSRPTPSTKKKSTSMFGGNTTCIYIEADDGTKHIIDAGTGIAELSQTLSEQAELPAESQAEPSPFIANLYFSHAHWDHIQGLPFFMQAYSPKNSINVYGEAKIDIKAGSGAKDNLRIGNDLERTLAYHPTPALLLSVKGSGIRQVLDFQQNPRNFPATLDLLTGINGYTDFLMDKAPGFIGTIYQTGTLQVDTMLVNHPGGCVAYRFMETKKDGKLAELVVNTDFEPNPATDKLMLNWWSNADLVIADCQYEPEGSPITKNKFMKGWGHSDFQSDIRLASAAEAKHILLTHHEPKMDDFYHLDLERRAQAHAKMHAPRVFAELAREQTVYEI